MFQRQTTGSVVCRACGRLVGVNDEQCFNCGARNPGLWGFAPLLRRLGNDLGFIQVVTWGCIGLYVLTLLYDPANIGVGGMIFSLLSPSSLSLVVFGGTGAYPVFELGRWWTLLSAGWLHGGLLHIGFNLMWVRQMAPLTADIYGPSRLVLIYTAGTIVGFLFSTLGGTFLTIGASAPIFGLFGALFWAGRRTGSSQIGQQALIYAGVLLVFGFLMPAVDNLAHIGGFVGGLLTGMILNPLREETFGNLLLALLCMAATAGAVLFSVVLAYF